MQYEYSFKRFVMSNVTVQSRVNPELKAQAESVFASMGMSTADAIRIFLQQSVNDGGLPFQPHAKIPNAETIAAFKEAEEGKTSYHENVDAMFNDLGI
jgi:DNA-damage-inducible protein J